MTSHVTHRTGRGRVTTAPAAARPAAPAAHVGRAVPAADRGITAGATAVLSLLAGLWVAVSPWFLVLQAPGAGSATASNVIVGLAVAALALSGLSGSRGLQGLQVGSLVLGAWVIISPFVLAAKFSVLAPMYWSNIWSGGVIMALALAALTAAGTRQSGSIS
jgi:hypothetical protein